MDEFYDTSKLDEVADQCKNHKITVIMRDTNAKVGKAVWRRETGKLVHRKTVMNTWVRQHLRKLWTWKSPGDKNAKSNRSRDHKQKIRKCSNEE